MLLRTERQTEKQNMCGSKRCCRQIQMFQSNPLEVLYKTDILKNFKKFKRKHLSSVLYVNEVLGTYVVFSKKESGAGVFL